MLNITLAIFSFTYPLISVIIIKHVIMNDAQHHHPHPIHPNTVFTCNTICVWILNYPSHHKHWKSGQVTKDQTFNKRNKFLHFSTRPAAVTSVEQCCNSAQRRAADGPAQGLMSLVKCNFLMAFPNSTAPKPTRLIKILMSGFLKWTLAYLL